MGHSINRFQSAYQKIIVALISIVGWNYTLALGFPNEVNDQVFSLMTKMQMSYYKFRFYKEFFNETFTDLLQNPSCIHTQKIEFFDRLQLNYHDFLSHYSKFKLGLFPKYYSEMVRVEKLWHIDNDIELMEKTFAAQAEYVKKNIMMKFNWPTINKTKH